MRILALGAAGEMGQAATAVLAAADTVTSVTAADRDARAARSVADSLGTKVTALKLDVTDQHALAAAMSECDLVVNTVGPYFRFGVPILSAAIAAGRDYVDICDDPEPTLDMLGLDATAKAAGVTAVVGMGASPGVSNLLAVIAGGELDQVHSILTGWSVDSAKSASAGGPSAALIHAMQQISGTIPVTRNRETARRPALERVKFAYPGIGAARGRSFGHPEAVTLHRAFPDLENSINVVVGDRFTLGLLTTLGWGIDRRLVGLNTAARLASIAEQALPPDPTRLNRPGRVPPLFAIASGTRDDRPASAAVALAQIPGTSMASNTGVPLAVAALRLNASARPGVHTPETIFAPDEFFTALSEHCLGRPHPNAMTITTRSWLSERANHTALGGSLLTAFLTSRS